MLNHSFTWNGHSSDEFGIKIERFPVLNRPSRKYIAADVPGRNGMVYDMQDAWSEVFQSYEIYAGGQRQNTVEEFGRITEWLHSANGYAELSDSYDVDHYRRAVYIDSIDIANSWNRYGRATVTFRCRPERFLNNGKRTYTYLDIVTVVEVISSNAVIWSSLKFEGETRMTVGTYAHWIEDVSVPNTITTTASVQAYYDEDMTIAAGTMASGVECTVWDSSHDDRYGVIYGSSALLYIGTANTTVTATAVYCHIRTYDGVTGYVQSAYVEKLANAIEIYNPTRHVAKPNITLGYGSNVLRINDLILTISDRIDTTSVIDCENENVVSEDGDNLNVYTTITDLDGNATAKFPSLKKGMNILIREDTQILNIDTRFWEI